MIVSACGRHFLPTPIYMNQSLIIDSSEHVNKEVQIGYEHGWGS